VTEGWAPLLAAGPDGRWVSADGHSLHVWSGTTLERSIEAATLFGGPPRVLSADSALAGRYEIDLRSGDATERVSLDAVLDAYDPQGDENQLAVRAVAWTADGSHALVLAEYLPTRLKGGSDAARPGGLLALVHDGSGQLHELDRGRHLDAGPLAGDRWLVSGGERLRAFAPDSGELALDLELDDVATAVATGGDTVAAGLAGGAVIAVAVADPDALRRWTDHSAVIDAVALSPDAGLIASGDRSGGLVVRRAGDDADPVLRTELPGRVDGLCFLAADHLVVALGGAERELRHIELNGAR
jgi:hypothetical protein